MNHVLLAACRDDQTAADARIDNDFNGAFTYHLCEAIRRAGGRIEHSQLIAELQQILRNGSFSQVPQLEPETASGWFLSDKRSTPKPDDAGADAGEPATSVPPLAQADSLDEVLNTATGTDNEQLRLQLLHKIVDLVGRERPSGIASGRATGHRVVVYVHGICRHERGYSDGWWRAMASFTPSLGSGSHGDSRHEVLWSDIVNSRSVTALAAGQTEEAEDVSEQLRATLEDRLLREMAEAEGTNRSLDLGVATPAAGAACRGLAVLTTFPAISSTAEPAAK